jgi:hypothetical protein
MKATARQPRQPGTKSGEAAPTAAPHGRVEYLAKRQLERAVTWTGRERLRIVWYRLRFAVQEMNYASKRMIELQMQLPDDWRQPLCGQRASGPTPGILDANNQPR